MLDYVIIRGEKEFPLNGILDLNKRSISHFNEIENLENLTSLKELHLQHNHIKTLEGLKNLKNLRLLQLNNNKITVLSNLESLENLETLDLSNNNIDKIGNDLELRKLKELDLYHNKLKNITGLENFVNLESLILSKNHIEKISGLSSLKKLKKLVLADNEINMIEGLESLEYLEKLYLGNNQIKTLKGLNNLYSLEELDLRSNKIKEIEGLENLSNLYKIKLSGNRIQLPIIQQFGENGKYYVKYCRGEYVIFENNYICVIDDQIDYENIKNVLVISGVEIHRIRDLKNIENLGELEGLNLGGNEISDIEGLDSLVNLKLLWLSSNNIVEIKGIKNLKKLEDLSLSFNEISRIEGLETLIHLKKLNLKSNFIKKIENLDKLTELNVLSLLKNKIEEITGLESLLKLKKLDLSKNKIKIIKGLNHLRNLKGLLLQENFLTELNEIISLSSLTILNLEKNQLKNINGIEKLINLTELNLADNNIEDIEELSNLRRLTKLGLEKNNIQDISSLKNLKNLKYINLIGNPIHPKIGHKLDLSNNNPRRYIAYTILKPIFDKLSGEIFWDEILKDYPFLNDFHLNEIKEIIKSFPEIQLLIENGTVKSFSTFDNLAKKLDTLIEPFKEQEDIPYSFITDNLYLPKDQDAKNICTIIIEKGLSRYPIYNTVKGIRKQVIKKKQEVLSNLRVLLLGSNCKGMKEVLVGREIRKIRKILDHSSIQFIDAPDIKRDDIYEKLSEFKPQIVHFSGHGFNKTGPLFNGDEFLINIPPPLFNQLIDVLKKGEEYIKLIIFNVCESSLIAEKVSKFIDFTIGIEKKANDRCVAAFSKGFYRILLHKDTIINAFDNGTIRFFNKHAEIKAGGLKRPYKMFCKNPGSLGAFTETFGENINNNIYSSKDVKGEASQEDFTEDQKCIILKLGELRDKIHFNYPFENIKVRYIDSDFYKYIDKEHWNRAKNQIVYKLKKEIEHLTELILKITSIRAFLSLEDRLKTILDSKESKGIDIFGISPESLMISLMKGSEQSQNNIKRLLEEQFYNISYLTGNFTTTFSEDGIYIFLDELDILETEKIKNYFLSLNKYTNKNIHINLDKDDITVEQILETSIKLIEKIDSEQIKMTILFLGKIHKSLEKIKEDFEKF